MPTNCFRTAVTATAFFLLIGTATTVWAEPTPSPNPSVPSIPPIPTPPPIPAATPVPPVPPVPAIPPVPSPPPRSEILELPTSANPQFVSVAIHYGQGGTVRPKNSQGRFQKVALQPGAAITVVMTFTAADSGHPADIQVLDGGAIGGLTPVDLPDVPKEIPTPYPTPPIDVNPTNPDTGPRPTPVPLPTPSRQQIIRDLDSLVDSGRTMPVSPTGQLLFGFRPGDGPGLHRVSVLVNGNQYVLQFWQQDAASPNNNPNMLRAY